MARSLLALALALSLGASGCVRGRGSDQEPFVADLELRGVTAVDPDDIEAVLATQGPMRRPGIAGAIVRDRQRLDPDALAADRRRVVAFYRERGYYDARVEDVTEQRVGRGLVKVVFRVVEGRPVRVSKVTVTGVDDIGPEAAARMERLPIQVGDVFTEGAYDAARSMLATALRSTGYATAEVSQSALVLREAGTAEVTYEVRPGGRYRFGSINIPGTSADIRRRVREQATAEIHPGEWWDETRLAAAQARVFNLGVFGGVRVVRDKVDETRPTINVVVAVSEAPFRTVRVGPGIGVQARRWDTHALAEWQHRNFLGDLRRVETDVRLGYSWVPNPFTPVKKGTVALVAGEFQQPGAFTRYADASARVEVERGVQDAYDFFAERLRLGVPLRLASRWTLRPSYNLEVYQLSNFTVDFVPGGAPPGEGPVLQNCRGSVCLLSYVEQRIAWDGRDDPVNTRRGLYVALSVQEGFQIQRYGYRYLRLVPELRAAYPLGRRTVLAFRTRVGALIPVGETGEPPLVARFTAGGPQSMRGYYSNRLAKMVRQRGEWVAVGGNGLSDGSLELRYELTRALGAALFVDAGAVSDASAKPNAYQVALDPTRLQWAAGVGLRYRTLFGPLRLDVAARLPDRFEATTDSFPAVPYTFWEDGTPHREPIVAVHLTIGEAF